MVGYAHTFAPSMKPTPHHESIVGQHILSRPQSAYQNSTADLFHLHFEDEQYPPMLFHVNCLIMTESALVTLMVEAHSVGHS